jgi:YVTN family beta-propeller protein
MFRLFMIGLLLSNIATALAADPPIARLIFQDHNTRTLKWADVTEAQDGKPVLGAVNDVVGFPKLEAKSQSLVQMKEYKGRLLVGVRGDEDGLPGSGWVMMSTGTKYTDHGDHGHWSFKKKPQVIASKIDSDGGNPAHLYLYEGQFYLANDKRNGYTRFDPEQFSITTAGTPVMGKPQFVSGGGNHITLATVAGKVGYGTWIDGGGPNKGRVDVTSLDGNGDVKYSFNLPTGVIHGATAGADKVFFAPADGICWVETDRDAKKTSADIKVNHISLGKDGEKPLRTGAFATHGHHVLCVTGKGTSSQLVLLDAKAKDLQPQFLKLSGLAGHKPLTPVVSATKEGKNLLAFVFHDHDAENKIDDLCEVIALDPNGDGKWDDAKVVKTLSVGPSAVSGHSGHHDIAFDADAKLAYITNPGNGTVTVVDLKTLNVTATLKVGGKPTALVVVGAKDHDD